MADRYQDVYPSRPLLDSARLMRPSATELLTAEYFEAEPGEMPTRVFAQHHILLNLRDEPQRVENIRDGERREFVFQRDEVVVTPAGVRSGWRWFERSKVVVVTLDPERLERFAQHEVGVVLGAAQLRNEPQFTDPELCRAGLLLRDAMAQREVGSEVLFESMARVFLVQLIQRYGTRHDEVEPGRGLGAHAYKRVLDFVAANLDRSIAVEDLAREVGSSPSHFTRQFKRTIGQTPHRFVISYRVEQARKLLSDRERPLAEVASRCGFADQAHFSRQFKRFEGMTPGAYRASLG
ncbi:MAG: AraC family transcriptional regulator [Acidobacteriota bacterium]